MRVRLSWEVHQSCTCHEQDQQQSRLSSWLRDRPIVQGSNTPLLALGRSDSHSSRTAVFFTYVAAGQCGASDTSPNQLPVDERPIITREQGQGHAGASPDERYDGSSAYGGADDVQGSPPKVPPRILHSGEGSRPHESREDQLPTYVLLVNGSLGSRLLALWWPCVVSSASLPW